MSCRALIDYKTERCLYEGNYKTEGCLYEGKAKGRKARATSTTWLKSMSVEPMVSSTTCTHTCSLHSGSEYVCVCMEHAGTSTWCGRQTKERPAHAAASSLGKARACSSIFLGQGPRMQHLPWAAHTFHEHVLYFNAPTLFDRAVGHKLGYVEVMASSPSPQTLPIHYMRTQAHGESKH